MRNIIRKSQKHKQNEFRYLIGDIYSYVLDDMYAKNPAKTIDNYADFLKNNASLSLDDSTKILFGNNKLSKKDIITQFISKLNNQTKKFVKDSQMCL